MKIQKNLNKGITLIALVVTIVVLLILAAVSISMLTGENGIITQAQEATVKNENGNVYEALQLKVSDYKIFYLVNNGEKIILSKLKEEGYVNEDNTLNVEKLTNEKMKTGKGNTDKGDVYILKNVDNSYYKLIYYTNKNEETNLGKAFDIIGDEELVATPEDYFEYDEGTKGIALKDSNDYYDYGVLDREMGLKTIVIPSTYEGKPVNKVGIEVKNKYGSDTRCVFGINVIDVEKIVIPNSVTSIGGDFYVGAFSNCRSLKSIIIPNTVKEIGSKAFSYCTSLKEIRIPESVTELASQVFTGWTEEQTIHVPFKEGEEPDGWSYYWKDGCNAKIVYESSLYNDFTQNYLANKNQEELEEIILKGEFYLGTFDELLQESGMTRNDLEQEAAEMKMTYVEYLGYILQEMGENSYIYIEYIISTLGYENKSEDELENIVIKEIIGEEEFNKILEEQGVTKEQLFEELCKQGFRSKQDLLKYIIYEGKTR